MDRFEFLYNFAQSQLLEQNERLKYVRTIAMSFMTLNLALLGVTWLILAELKQEFSYVDVIPWMFAIAVAISFILSVFYSMKTVYVATWHVGAHPQKLRELTADAQHSDEQLVEWAAETLTDAYNRNNTILDRKSDELGKGIFFLWMEISFVVTLSFGVLFSDFTTYIQRTL